MTTETAIHSDPLFLRIDSLRLDEFETGLLPVLRHFLDSHTCPESQAWRHAYTIAAERWGDAVGLAAAHALQNVVSALLACRSGGIAYSDPLCLDSRELVTAEEAAFLRMLHHMRRDQTALARNAVEELTGGLIDPHVVRAGLSLAHRFSCGAPAGSRAPGRPRLRVAG